MRAGTLPCGVHGGKQPANREMAPLDCQTLELTPRDSRGGEAQASGHGKNDSPFTRCERGGDTPKAAPAPGVGDHYRVLRRIPLPRTRMNKAHGFLRQLRVYPSHNE